MVRVLHGCRDCAWLERPEIMAGASASDYRALLRPRSVCRAGKDNLANADGRQVHRTVCTLGNREVLASGNDVQLEVKVMDWPLR